jgi:hypothetical protein
MARVVNKGPAMEVDRVTQMGGVGHEAAPVWQKSSQRRRKFTQDASTPEHHDEDAPPDQSPDPESTDPDPDDKHSGLLDVMA